MIPEIVKDFIKGKIEKGGYAITQREYDQAKERFDNATKEWQVFLKDWDEDQSMLNELKQYAVDNNITI